MECIALSLGELCFFWKNEYGVDVGTLRLERVNGRVIRPCDVKIEYLNTKQMIAYYLTKP